jgi:chromosome partitioning protein
LLIDLDSQNALTSYFVDDYAPINGKTILEVLTDKVSIQDSIMPIRDNLHFIPSDISLCNLTIELTENRDFKLYMALEEIKDNYDYIVIDTPPSLHIETKLALVVTNYVVIPSRPERWSARSIEIVVNYIRNKNTPLQNIIKMPTNKISVLHTHVDKRFSVDPIIFDQVKKKFGDILLEDVIWYRSEAGKVSFIGCNKIDLSKLELYGYYSAALKNILS